MKIAKLALITAILGIIILAVLANTLEPKSLEISKITNSKIGEFIKTEGTITAIKDSKIMNFNLADKDSEIRVLYFDKIDLTKGDQIEVIGKINQYYNSLQIEATKITKKQPQ